MEEGRKRHCFLPFISIVIETTGNDGGYHKFRILLKKDLTCDFDF